MLAINAFIDTFEDHYPEQTSLLPWQISSKISEIVLWYISHLSTDKAYVIQDGIAIHTSAVIEQNVVLKGPVIIGPGCYIGANSYLRAGVHLVRDVKIGPGCEIKTSLLFCRSAVAHFNYIGDSIIGNHVNFEAGSVIANHYNERERKEIKVRFASEIIETGIDKFGALVGDGSKIGANAVLSPGTILEKNAVVNRLELVEQVKL